MTIETSVSEFKSGIHNLLPDEQIPLDAASDSQNWVTKDGRIELIRGRQTIGEAGAVGKIYGQHVGYKANGTAVHFRKADGKIQYLNGSTWTDVITGLTVNADYTFSNYQSLAGAFTYIFGIDGIYKIAVANPGSYTSLYDASKNFQGYAIIDKARSILWGRTKDPTGLYGSYIDNLIFTTVSGEATTSLSGTLAFKAGGATRTCFAVTITLTGTGEVYTDNFNGVLTGDMGGTGTINYTTGAYTVTNSGVGTATYQWENSNNKGVTDFTKSSTRLAGEGFTVRQDAGGDAIISVIPLDGAYFSMKKNSCYKFELDATDLAPINILFRSDIGVKTLRSAVATGFGIVFINTANPSKPVIQVLKRSEQGGVFTVDHLFKQFAFENYDYSDGVIDSYDEYLIIGCKEMSDENNRLLLCNFNKDVVDVTTYGVRAVSKNAGYLYGGSNVSLTTYEMFTGFDDLTLPIENYWISRGETYTGKGRRNYLNVLKKVKKMRFKGQIDPAQTLQVYVSTDNGDYALVGTILGTGDYVDYTSSFAVGTTFIGQSTIGGGDQTPVYQFFMEIKLKLGKFRKRNIKFVATGIGYCSVNYITDFDIWTFENRLPARYRSKQNVSLDGVVNQAH